MRAVRTSSGNWSYAMEPQQSLRSQLKASGSFSPAAGSISRAPSTTTTVAGSPPGGGGGGGASAAGSAVAGGSPGQRRPCAPQRMPSASPAASRGAPPRNHGDDDDEVRGAGATPCAERPIAGCSGAAVA